MSTPKKRLLISAEEAKKKIARNVIILNELHHELLLKNSVAAIAALNKTVDSVKEEQAILKMELRTFLKQPKKIAYTYHDARVFSNALKKNEESVKYYYSHMRTTFTDSVAKMASELREYEAAGRQLARCLKMCPRHTYTKRAPGRRKRVS